MQYISVLGCGDFFGVLDQGVLHSGMRQFRVASTCAADLCSSNPYLCRFLRDTMRQIVVLELRGSIFFGSSADILQEVEAHVKVAADYDPTEMSPLMSPTQSRSVSRSTTPIPCRIVFLFALPGQQHLTGDV